MKRFCLLMLVLALAFSLVGQTTSGDVIPIRQGANIEWFRSSTAIDAGIVYIWSDTRWGGRDLYGQLISPSGQRLWGAGEGLLVDGKSGRQEDPMVVTASDGNVIVAWVDFSLDKDGDIYANKIDPDGQRMWGTDNAGIIVCNATRVQIAINMVADDDGGAYIAWSDQRTSTTQIYIQHINGSGVATWAPNGINVDPLDTNKVSNTMWEDENGGAVMAYTIQYNQSSETGVSYIRFHKSISDAIDWGPHIVATQTSPTAQPQSNPKMSPDGQGGFIFVWETKDLTDSNYTRLKAQRITSTGAKLWGADGKNVTGDFILTGNQEKHRVIEVEAGGAIVAWEDKRGNNSTPNICIQKLNLDGDPQWLSGGKHLFASTADTQSDLRMSKTSDGGAAIVWEDSRLTDVSNRQVFVQKVESNGDFAWTDGGVLVSDETGGQSGANVKQMGNNFAVVWADQSTGSVGLSTQIFNSSGTPTLTQNGIDVYYGLSGNAEDLILKTFENKSYVFWYDTRHGNMGRKIYYQIVDENGAQQFPQNGQRVSHDDLLVGSTENSFNAEINDAGQICIVWLKSIGGRQSVFAQIINPNGSKGLGEAGMELKNNGSSTEMAPKVYWRNNGWEIFWNENGIAINSEVYGQRIVGDARVWGDDAKCILSDLYMGGIDSRSCTFLSAKGDYLVYKHTGGQYYLYIDNYKIIKIDENGTPLSSWPEFGQILPAYSNLNESNVFLYEDIVAIIWTEVDATTEDQAILVTLLDTEGVPILDPPIVNLTQDLNAIMQINAYQNGNIITVSFSHQETSGCWKNKALRFAFSQDGINHLWGTTGKTLLPSETDPAISQNSATTLRYGTNHVSVWSMDPFFISNDDLEEPADDIYLSILDADGQHITSDINGLVVSTADKKQELPKLGINSSDIITVAFRDGRSSGKEPIYGLYMQKVSMPPMSEQPDIAIRPFRTLNSVENYPNPFNPTTTIAFDIATPAVVSIDVYNIKGQLVRSLVNAPFEKGKNIIVWNGTNNTNTPVGSGVYFYQINTNGEKMTRKMLLMK